MKRTRESERFFTSGEVAELLGVSRRTLQNWLKSGLIPEPFRNPLTLYRRWTDTDISEIRRIVTERRSSDQARRQ